VRVLDLGCGEGWLVRALGLRGIAAIGIDGSNALIEAAQAAGGEFACLSYEQLGDARVTLGEIDLAVANFALLGEQLEPCLRELAKLLTGQRRLLIQTLHPLGVEPPYEPGWRRESFAGFGQSTEWAPMPWYFRPFGAWVELLGNSGFVLERVIEPLDAPAEPAGKRPLSLILDARVG
jgi:SAM-dependent methyltransferase